MIAAAPFRPARPAAAVAAAATLTGYTADQVTKAVAAIERGDVRQVDAAGHLFEVASASDPARTYRVDAAGRCDCDARKACWHAAAVELVTLTRLPSRTSTLEEEPMPESETTPRAAGIYPAMAAIFAEVRAVPKEAFNRDQGFPFRSVEQVMNELHQIMAVHKVFLLPEVVGFEKTLTTVQNGNRTGTQTDVDLSVRFHFAHADGSEVTATCRGEGRDRADKATSKAHTMALKTMLLEVFMVPTADLADPDATSPGDEPDEPRQAERRRRKARDARPTAEQGQDRPLQAVKAGKVTGWLEASKVSAAEVVEVIREGGHEVTEQQILAATEPNEHATIRAAIQAVLKRHAGEEAKQPA